MLLNDTQPVALKNCTSITGVQEQRNVAKMISDLLECNDTYGTQEATFIRIHGNAYYKQSAPDYRLMAEAYSPTS